jgi:hypothetical protein
MEMGKEEECQVKLIVYQRVADQDKWLVETTDVEKCPTDPEPEPEREKSSSGQYKNSNRHCRNNAYYIIT